MPQSRLDLPADVAALSDEEILKFTDHELNFMTATRLYSPRLIPFMQLAADRNGRLLRELIAYYAEHDKIDPTIETTPATVKSLLDRATAFQARLIDATQQRDSILKMRVPTEDDLLGLYRRHGLSDDKVQRITLEMKESYLRDIRQAQLQRKGIEAEDPNNAMLQELNENKPELETLLTNLRNIARQQNLSYPAPGTLSSGGPATFQPKSPATSNKAAAPTNTSPVLQPRPGG